MELFVKLYTSTIMELGYEAEVAQLESVVIKTEIIIIVTA